MKKVGQPETATELTAGRATLLRQLWGGTADREGMAMAANWMRDIWTERDRRPAETIWPYKSLVEGGATDLRTQRVAAEWLANQCGVLIESLDSSRIQWADTPSSANNIQVGGDHYKKKTIQHWDFYPGHGYGYLLGRATAYLSRWRDKNGRQDLEKGAHFLQKEEETALQEADYEVQLSDYLDAQGITSPKERSMFFMLHAYHLTGDLGFLAVARGLLAELLAETPA